MRLVPNPETARRLRSERKKVGVTIVQLAKAMGVTEDAVYKYQNGTLRPSLQNAIVIQELVGISPEDWWMEAE